MKRRHFIAALGTAPLLAAAATGPRPNLLLIVADDMRFDQLAHMGHPYIQTPNLDRLAKEGARFTNAYAPTPLCGPVRASILTGRMASVHGRRDNFNYPPTMEPYFPESFHDQGYRTAMIGKFYEGAAVEKKVKDGVYDFWFKNVGPDFSAFEGTSAKERSEFHKAHLYYDQVYQVGRTSTVVKGHQTDVLFEQAAEFAGSEPNKPFLVFMSPFAPHAPFNPSLRRKGNHAGKGIPPRGNIENGVGYMTPARTRQFAEMHERTCEMVEDIDDGVGRILETLEKTGQLDNTILVFTSDNGVVLGEHGFGWKRHPWEESIKVPLLVRYPKAVQPGTVCDAVVSLADLFPSCAEWAGIALPDDPLRYGKSWAPLLAGAQTQLREATLVMQYEEGLEDDESHVPEHLEWVSLRAADGWKLIRYRTGPPANMRPDYGKTFLFNLNDDPLEMKNLAANPEYQAILRRMNARLVDELKQNQVEAAWLQTKP